MTELARARVLEAEEPEALPEVITPAQWVRILDGRKVRYLVTAERIAWAGRRAASCGACKNTKMHGDPRRGWCTAHRFLTSMAFTVLCREFKAS